MMPENEQKSEKRKNAPHPNNNRKKRTTPGKGRGRKKKSFLSKYGSMLLIILIFLIGLSVLLYPNISEYFNSRNSSRAVANYESDLAKTSETERQEMLAAARAYNQELLTNDTRFEEMSAAQLERYNSVLNINGEGMMCYMEIPSLGVSLPVYHTTGEIVLQRYIGHVEGSSLPVGGLGTHAVLSGHRGLPSAELFTNLDRMEEGDLFQIHVLGEVLTYQVDDISVVLPEEVTQLTIDLEQDWVTLVTCTPYGVNTHRLLVRGTRIETPEDLEAVMGDTVMMTKLNISLWIALGMGVLFLIILIMLWLSSRKKKGQDAEPAKKKKKRKKRPAGGGRRKTAPKTAVRRKKPTTEPKSKEEPEPKAEPESTTGPKPKAELGPKAEPELESKQEPVPVVETAQTPEPTQTSETKSEPTPETEQRQEPALKQDTKPDASILQEEAFRYVPQEWEAALQSAMHAQVELMRKRMEVISAKEEVVRNRMETIGAQEDALSDREEAIAAREEAIAAREEAIAAREASVSAKEAYLRELLLKPEKDDE